MFDNEFFLLTQLFTYMKIKSCCACVASVQKYNLESLLNIEQTLPCNWLFFAAPTGGGYLVGRVDSEGEFSGGSLCYLYPDLASGLLGTFHTGHMVSCQAVSVIGTLRRTVLRLPAGSSRPTSLSLRPRSTFRSNCT
jgi:hypothetical protein